MVTQLEITISQLLVGFICFQIGMVVEHWINERRWKAIGGKGEFWNRNLPKQYRKCGECEYFNSDPEANPDFCSITKAPSTPNSECMIGPEEV